MCHNMSQKHFYLQGIHFSRLTPGATQGFVVRADTSEVVLGKWTEPVFFVTNMPELYEFKKIREIVDKNAQTVQIFRLASRCPTPCTTASTRAGPGLISG